MAFFRVRLLPHLLLPAISLLALDGAAIAGRNDLQLFNLCPQAVSSCPWIQSSGGGVITQVKPDADGQSKFRSLMSELGVVVAPRLQTPADTLGYAGFQFSAELGFTKINRDQSYWDGVQGVNAANPSASRPDQYLTTVGGFVRKGILPPFEIGGGAVSILGSSMYSLQGYAKLALFEGFHDWPLPSLAVRGAASQLLGTDQVELTVFGVDVLISKAFSLAGTARFEPFVGWNYLFIRARSGVIDATPSCDAYAQHLTPPSAQPPSMTCAASQNGTFGDLNANFAFPTQDLITRQRWFGGVKLKLTAVFVAGEVDIIPAGRSHDQMQPEGAGDASGTQQSFSLSAGFDF
jgi:hypothetical protein